MKKIFKYDNLEPTERGFSRHTTPWYVYSEEIRLYREQLFNRLCGYLNENIANSWECVVDNKTSPISWKWVIHDFERRSELKETLFGFTAKTIWCDRTVVLSLSDDIYCNPEEKCVSFVMDIKSDVKKPLTSWKYLSIEQKSLFSSEYWPLGAVTNHLYQFILQYYKNLPVEDKLKLLPDNVVELVRMVNKVDEII